jgi:diaminohydroxyphosphoribosylaminopyrimidine deaminase/5-amino-6-(5-phosphoribosylamino)uracil reductase
MWAHRLEQDGQDGHDEANSAQHALSDEARAWSLLRGLSRLAADGGGAIESGSGLALESAQTLRLCAPHQAWIIARPDLIAGWSAQQPIEPAAAQLLDTFMPLCVGARAARLVLAHLGQSADGHAATPNDTGQFITGHEDIVHTHRLRALFDAVLVGASTVAVDNPMLTTRWVEGTNPVRVVLDPQARLPTHSTVLRDRNAPTLVVISRPRPSSWPKHVETLTLPCAARGLSLPMLLAELQARGLGRIFIEGGARTVRHFLRAKLLDRIQIAVAPLQLGGQPPSAASDVVPARLSRWSRRTRQLRLGEDTLFDMELGPSAEL